MTETLLSRIDTPGRAQGGWWPSVSELNVLRDRRIDGLNIWPQIAGDEGPLSGSRPLGRLENFQPLIGYDGVVRGFEGP